MKKNIFFLAFLTISVIIFYSCNNGQTYTIKMRLNKGDTFSEVIQLNMIMNTSIMKTKMNMEIGSSFEVLNTGAEKELKMVYNKAHTTIDMGNYNSINKMSDSVLNKNNNRILGKAVTIKLSEDNEIVNVEGLENIISDSTDAATKAAMQKIFSRDQINNLFGMMFNMYPKKPVRVGESWNREAKITMGGIDMGIKIKYTLVSVKDGLSNIDLDGVINGKGKLVTNRISLDMNMSGDQKGTYVIKMSNGYLDHASYKLNMKADMDMLGQKVPVTINSDCTIKGM